MDVRSPTEVSNFFSFIDSKYGALDILVNNAGVGIFRPVADLTFEDWKRDTRHQPTECFTAAKEANTAACATEAVGR